jgi:hypothetical protein
MSHRSHHSGGVNDRRAWRWFVAAGSAGAAAAALPAGTALADTSGSVKVTINVAVRSVSLSPTATDQCSGGAPLTFPNGRCNSTTITVTNGSAAGHIDVQGADAIPQDLATHWTLCGGTGPACTGGGPTVAGQD